MNFSDYLNSRDMFDGGGAGKAGDEFEGGGLLSFLANLVAKPLGSQKENEQPSMAAGGASDIVPLIRPMSKPVPPAEAQSPYQMFGGQPPAPYSPQQSPMEMFGGQPPAPYQPDPVYSGRGHAGMPMPSYAQSPTEQETIQYLRSLGYRV